VKKLVVISLALVLVLTLGITGCGGEEVAPTKVLLGATLPLDGTFGGFGEQGFGMQKAVDDWNAAYGGMYMSE